MPPTSIQTGRELQVQAPFTFPWAEATPSPAAFSQGYALQMDGSQATWTIDMNWLDIMERNYAAEILGYSRRIAGNNNSIERNLPVAHPYFSWLYATAINNIQGFGHKGKYQANFASGNISSYDRARVTIGFSTLPFDIMSDLQLQIFHGSDESYRYVTKLSRATSEYIAIERGFFKFAEGAGPAGQSFPLGTGRVTVKVDLEWIWNQVPDTYIFNSSGIATNIFSCLGKVNSTAIWGYPAGTLLCLPCEFTPRMMPVSPTLLGLQPWQPPRAWDVKLLFKYWDPPLTAGATTRGHNTAMWVVDGLFALIKSVDAMGALSGTLFQSADFNTIFRAVTS